MNIPLDTIPFRWFKASDGSPADGYTAKFYEAGTLIPKTIFSGPGNNPYPSPSNEALLNAEGWAIIYLGAGQYKIQVTDELDNPVFTQDNIGGVGAFGTGFLNSVIDPTAGTDGLKDLDPVANPFTWCAGYKNKGDGGHGFFWSALSIAPDDTGYVIASTANPSYRWFRIPDESTDVRAASFGYIGTTAANLSNELLAASGYATGNNHRLTIGPGTAATIGQGFSNFSLYATGGLHLESGSMLTGDGVMTILDITGPVTGSPETHFTGFQTRFQTVQANANPEWFGAFPLPLFDNTIPFTAWLASLAETFTLPPGIWGYGDTTTFTYPTVPFNLLGTIHAIGFGTDIPPGFYYPDPSIFSGGIFKATNKLQFQAGTSTTYIRSGGQLRNIIGSASTVGTAETDLLNFSLGLNTLMNVGDRIRITAAGNYTGISGDKIPRCKIGGVFIGGGNQATTDTGRWRFEIDLYYTGVGTSFSEWVNFEFAFTPILFSTNINTLVPASINFTIANVLKITGQCTAGALNNTLLNVDFFPAP